MKVWGNRQIIKKPSKFVIVSYLKDNNIYPVPMTIRVYYFVLFFFLIIDILKEYENLSWTITNGKIFI